ncbi:transposase [Magnetospirillum sp. SS-4]|nr:transposase [Magnetospirillum sp. SS-4]
MVAAVARRYEVNANQLFGWRKLFGPPGLDTMAPGLVPVVLTVEPQPEPHPVARDDRIEIELAGGYRKDNRLFVDAVLWIARSGSHWRELPEVFGNWNSVFARYNRWAKNGVWERVFQALSGDPDFEYVLMDSTIIRAHQHSAGAKGGMRRRKPLAVPGAG